MVHLFTPNFDDNYVPFFHHPCICNEEVSIVNRVLGMVPPPSRKGILNMASGIDLIISQIPYTHQEPLGQFAMNYSGSKRERYLNAAEDCYHTPVVPRDAGITMFVKKEKTQVKESKPNPDPRAVQFRDAKYCVELASFLKPIERHLYELVIDHPLTSSTRVVAKGMNSKQRGNALKEKWDMFVDPIALTFDAKRFDKHVSVDQLRQEYRVYLASNPSHRLRFLLNLQLTSKCRTRSGIHYVVNGGRMSGDMNTALGNCIIVLSMFIAILVNDYRSHFELLDDGDDIVVLIERSGLAWVKANVPGLILEMGHEIDLQCEATSLEQVIWCQSNPVEYLPGLYKFVRNPYKVMSNGLVGTRFWSTSQSKQQMQAIGLCELSLNQGIPVLQEYALMLIRQSVGYKPRFDGEFALVLRAKRELYDFSKQIGLVKPKLISDCCRVSFANAFNISIQQQLDMECHLKNVTINFAVTHFGDDLINFELIRPRVEFG
jgi:hypothetical protein